VLHSDVGALLKHAMPTSSQGISNGSGDLD
jgi:hypothetical protein